MGRIKKSKKKMRSKTRTHRSKRNNKSMKRYKKKSEKPKAIIANTVKGKGFSFSENNNNWHHAVLSKSQYEIALKELEIS